MARALHIYWSIRAVRSLVSAGIVALLLGGTPAIARAGLAHFGFAVDAGVPEGMSGALTYRPMLRLRFHAGVGHNFVGPGVRAGAAFRFTRSSFAPILSVEAGRFFRADAEWLTAAAGTDADAGALDSVGYDYASARLGFEASGDDATFYMELGASGIRSALYFEESNDTMEVRSRTDLEFLTLSGRAGVLVWF